MARRSGLVELPWQVSLGLALASYVVLHIVARKPMAPAVAALQFALPLAFIGWALWSLRQRSASRREDYTGRADGADGAAVVEALSWPEFKRLIGEAFRRRGYRVEPTPVSSGNSEVDLELTLDGERFCVQCKPWRARKVGAVTVRELCSVMAARAAVGGFIITSGSFSADARSFAEDHNVELIDGAHLSSMIASSGDEDCDTQRVAIVRALEWERDSGRD